MADSSILMRLDGLKIKYEELGQKLTDPEVIADVKSFVQYNKEYKELEPIIETSDRFRKGYPRKREGRGVSRDGAYGDSRVGACNRADGGGD